MVKSLNIALLADGFMTWSGGCDFLRNCAYGLTALEETASVNIFLLVPEADVLTNTKNILRPFRNTFRELIHFRKPMNILGNSNSHEGLLLDSFRNLITQKVDIIYYKKNRNSLIASLRQIKADVALPAIFSLGKQFPVPWVGYIYDFQHKYFPKYFPEKIRMKRDRDFKEMTSDARAIIVNSISVKNDIKSFYPESNCEVFSLPFAPIPHESWFSLPVNSLNAKYSLPEKYFLISNQFNVHKSHLTAFQALSIFLDQVKKREVFIVCTGKTENSLFPEYIYDLRFKIKELKIDDRVIFLGHIPKIDQIQIMRNSIAVLQPTLFEGGPGGGSVYDAVTLGVPAIVSDIPINLEISEKGVFFFKTNSAEDLALKMAEVFHMKRNKRPDQETLLKRGHDRMVALGLSLFDAIQFVTNNK